MKARVIVALLVRYYSSQRACLEQGDCLASAIAAYSVHPNNFTVDTALPWVVSSTPVMTYALFGYKRLFLKILKGARESEPLHGMMFGGVTVNRGPLAIQYMVCTSGGSNALLINMSCRSPELALDTALPWVFINTPDKWEAYRMNSC